MKARCSMCGATFRASEDCRRCFEMLRASHGRPLGEVIDLLSGRPSPAALASDLAADVDTSAWEARQVASQVQMGEAPRVRAAELVQSLERQAALARQLVAAIEHPACPASTWCLSDPSGCACAEPDPDAVAALQSWVRMLEGDLYATRLAATMRPAGES